MVIVERRIQSPVELRQKPVLQKQRNSFTWSEGQGALESAPQDSDGQGYLSAYIWFLPQVSGKPKNMWKRRIFSPNYFGAHYSYEKSANLHHPLLIHFPDLSSRKYPILHQHLYTGSFGSFVQSILFTMTEQSSPGQGSLDSQTSFGGQFCSKNIEAY